MFVSNLHDWNKSRSCGKANKVYTEHLLNYLCKKSTCRIVGKTTVYWTWHDHFTGELTAQRSLAQGSAHQHSIMIGGISY